MKIIQFFYNLFFPIAFLFILPFYLPRMFQRGGYQDKFLQRLGIFGQATVDRIGTGRLWIHAVSVGETFIALKFIHHWKQRHPEAKFILSITTTTALEIANKQACDWLEPIANPIDFFFISNAIIKLFKPAALIMVEGDVWPQRLLSCKDHGIPTAIITARLSPRSERRLQRFRWMTAPFFNLIDLIALPTEKDRERWISLGVNPSHSNLQTAMDHRKLAQYAQPQNAFSTGLRTLWVCFTVLKSIFRLSPCTNLSTPITACRLKITGNIKFDQQQMPIVTPPVDGDAVIASLGWKKEDPIFLAGSTSDLEEEKIIIAAWLVLRQRFLNLRLIVAPRHAERRHELLSLFQKLGVGVALRSEKISSAAEALILDTTGELNAWYLMSTVVFVGKSLGVGTAHGGQNPVEPLVLGKPVLVGPSMENFEPLISELRSAGGVLEVRNQQEMVQAVEELLLNSEKKCQLVEHGLKTLEQHQGSTDRASLLIEELLTSTRRD